MRGKSHISLGHYLIGQYLPDLSGLHQRFFLLGCIEPDRNPVTYLKGSIRCRWLRGHNYRNASRFMHRISCRLERKKKLNCFDYYTLGKLIHYTADAFTSAHNDFFPEKLTDHRRYEIQLQNHFLEYLRTDPQVDIRLARSIMDCIVSHHQEYATESPDIYRDSRFALQACCCVLAILLTPRIV